MESGAFPDRGGGYQGPGRGSVQTGVNETTQADLAVVYALTATTITYQQCQIFHAHFSQRFFETRATNRSWIIDSGASYHLTCDPSLFADLQQLEENIAVTVGNLNGKTIKAVGTRRVYLDFPCGSRIAITPLYIPRIPRSLFSVSQFNNILPLTFRNGYCYCGNQRIAILRDALYELLATPVQTRLSSSQIPLLNNPSTSTNPPRTFATTIPTLEIWHLRLGHLGLESLKKLLPPTSYSNNEKADTTIQKCVTCVQAKQQRSYNGKPIQKTTKPFHLLYSDLCGSLAVSHSGYRYFILYIDDFSRTAWVHFLRSKKAKLFRSSKNPKPWLIKNIQSVRFGDQGATPDRVNTTIHLLVEFFE